MQNSWLVFLGNFFSDTDIYIEILIAIFLVYWIFYRKLYRNIIDPLNFTILSAAFAISAPIFMLYENMIITEYYFYLGIISELTFLLGMRLFVNFKFGHKKTIKYKDEAIIKDFVLIYSCIYFSVKIIMYISYGVPLFDFSNHVDARLANGLLTKLSDAYSSVTLFVLLYSIVYMRKRKYIILFLLYASTMILDGSKVALIGVFFSYFYICLYREQFGIKIYKINKKFLLFFIPALIFMALLTLVTYNGYSYYFALLNFLARIAGNGDIFIFAYNGDILDYIIQNNDFVTVFVNHYLATLRLIPQEEYLGDIGYLMSSTIYNSIYATAGPNARHNIFGLVCFGAYGSLIYSFLLGASISLITRGLYRSKCMRFIPFIFYIILYGGVIKAPTELTLAVDYIIWGMLFNLFVIIGYILWKKIVQQEKVVSIIN